MTQQELATEASNNLMPPSIHQCSTHSSTHPSTQHNCGDISQQSDVASSYVYTNAASSSTFATAASSSTFATAASVSASTFATAQQSVINMNVAKKLNYASSTSAFCVDALVQNEDLMKSRERIRDEKNKGKDVHEQLKSVKKLTAGKLFKVGTTRLGKSLLDIHRENSKKEFHKERDRLIKEKAKYDESVIKAREILDKDVPFEKLKVKEMYQVLAPLKRKGDKWPNKRKDLIALYSQVKDRPPLEFNIDPIVGAGNNDDKNMNQINDNDRDNNTATTGNDSFTDFAIV